MSKTAVKTVGDTIEQLRQGWDGWNEDLGTTDHTAAMAYVSRLSDAGANFVMRDCEEAIKCNPTGKKAGHYQDLSLYCQMRLAGKL